MSGIVEVSTTLETAEQARDLARHLVESKLAACVQITGPIQSVYRWQSEICDESEFRCTVKSSQELLEELMQAIDAAHPYDVPEILAIEMSACSEAYAQWLRSQLKT